MKLVPLGDRVVLKQVVAEETTKSGIVIPGQSKEKPQQAEVVAVGPGGMVNGFSAEAIIDDMQRSRDGCKSWSDSHLFQICRNNCRT